MSVVRRRSSLQNNANRDYIPLETRLDIEDDVEQSKVQKQPEFHDSIEQPKVAYSISRLTALRYGSIHVLPVLVTAVILSFASRNYYWADLGAPNQNLILNALQYAAKAHEILMAASLTAVVLHRIQRRLISSSGIPLGLVTAGYRLSDLGYVFSKEIWAGLIAPQRSNRFRWAWFTLLVVSAIALTTLVGPSSAVIMIPQLDWWPISNPFPDSTEASYLNISAHSIWPQIPPNPVSSKTSDQFSINYGYRYVKDWVSESLEADLAPNITVEAGALAFRYLSTTKVGTGGNSSLYAATTISQRQASDLASFWQFFKARLNIKGPQRVSRPLIQPRFTNQSTVMKKPLVQVECTESNLTTPPQALEFPHYKLHSQNSKNGFRNLYWPVPDTFLDWTTFRSTLDDPDLAKLGNFSAYLKKTYLNLNASFVDVSKYSNGPSAAAVFIVLDDTNSARIVPCSIFAYWSPTSIWINPNSDTVVHDDSPDASAIFQTAAFNNTETFPQITLPLSWTNLLDVPLDSREPDYSASNNVTTLTDIMSHWRSIANNLPNLVYISPIGQLIAQALSLYIAESLARVNYIDRGSWVLHVPDGKPNNFLFNNLDAPNDGNLVAQYAEVVKYGADNVTKFDYDFHRYGYAWSFRSLTTKLAAVALIMQALLAIGDFLLLAWTGWISSGWRSPGEILALALRRDGSTALRNAGVKIEEIQTWSGFVSVRTTEGDPETVQLHIDENGTADAGGKLSPDKKYQ